MHPGVPELGHVEGATAAQVGRGRGRRTLESQRSGAGVGPLDRLDHIGDLPPRRAELHGEVADVADVVGREGGAVVAGR